MGSSSGLSSAQADLDLEPVAVTAVAGVHATADLLDERTHDRQADPRARDRLLVLASAPDERLEHAREQLGFDTGATVANDE